MDRDPAIAAASVSEIRAQKADYVDRSRRRVCLPPAVARSRMPYGDSLLTNEVATVYGL